MKTVDIKGNDYVMVNERVKAFKENFKDCGLFTEMLSNENGMCVFKASITDPNGRVVSTGHAYEKESSSFINKTSYIENCETSAVGRALGFFGIGIDTSIASYEEVNNAIKQQDENIKNQDKKDGTIQMLEDKMYDLQMQLGISNSEFDKSFLKKYGTTVMKATEADLRTCIADMEKAIRDKGAKK